MVIQPKDSRISQICVIICLVVNSTSTAPEPAPDFPTPLYFEEIPRIAKENRAEVRAAQARINASRQRENIVSGLEDPMISPSIDHWPFGMSEADVSFGIEQRFPLSKIRGQQRRGAKAQTLVSQAEASRTTLDVQINATDAFLMLYERRGMLILLEKQKDLLTEIVAAVNARYRSGSSTSTQADVIRSEIELARIKTQIVFLQSQIKSSEAMLNASLGREVNAPVPQLVLNVNSLQLSDSHTVVTTALMKRPEIAVAQAQIQGTLAQIRVMHSMYWPMLTVRGGPAFTMEEGPGLMFMLGISVPIWRSKLRAGVAEAQEMERMTRSELQAMKRMIEGEALSAFNNIKAEKNRYTLLKNDVLARVNQSISPTLSEYATGLLPLVSVIESVRMLRMTQEELLQAEVAVGSTWIRLRSAMGTLEEVNDE